jgi:drug/metabolite transporter (DMT)-like permease
MLIRQLSASGSRALPFLMGFWYGYSAFMFPSILTVFLWATALSCAHRSAHLLRSAAAANLARLVLGTVLLALWAHLFGKGLTGAGVWWFVWSGFVGFGLGDVALYETLPRLGARLSSLVVQCLAAVFGAMIEWLWLGTRLSMTQIGAGAVILAGVALALAPREHAHRERRMVVSGVLFGVLGALGQAGGAVLSRKGYQVTALAGQTLDGGTAAYQRIVGGIGVALVFFIWLQWRGNGEQRPTGAWRKAAPWIVANALTGPVVGVACYQWALGIAPSGVVLPIVATVPLAVMPLAYVLEGDRPSVRSLIGGAMAIAGVVALTLAH